MSRLVTKRDVVAAIVNKELAACGSDVDRKDIRKSVIQSVMFALSVEHVQAVQYVNHNGKLSKSK